MRRSAHLGQPDAGPADGVLQPCGLATLEERPGKPIGLCKHSRGRADSRGSQRGIIAAGYAGVHARLAVSHERGNAAGSAVVGICISIFTSSKAPRSRAPPTPPGSLGVRVITAALDALAAGIATRQGFVVITGAPGVGKTTVVHAYLARVAPPQLTTVVLWQARLAFRELLALLARRFDVQCRWTLWEPC